MGLPEPIPAQPRYGPGKNRRLADFRFFAPGQTVAPALDGGRELREVDLEGVEDVVGVVLGAEPDLALARASLLDDLVRLPLGLLDDLLVRDQAVLLVARLLQDALGLALGLRQHLLALLDDPARLLDLIRDRRAHLVEDVVDLLLVDAHLIRQRNRLGVVDLVVELVDENEYVHVNPSVRQRLSASSRREATRSGTKPDRSPPNIASSLTPLERRNVYWGEENM